jgi:PAS domain S-box-containing protein
LLQVLGDALLRENYRTRQFEETALKLEEANRAKDRATHELEQKAVALRESEEHYRTLFDLGPVAVYSCDVSGVIQEFNRRAAELWGRTPVPGDTDERFCGSFKLFRPDGTFMPHEQFPMAEVVSGKIAEACDAEVLIERPDGTRVTVIVNIRPLKNERGEVIGAINCFYDISGRKQAEKAAAALAAIVESSDDAIVSKDLDGIVTSWNKGAERLFGYTAEEAIGQSVTRLIPPERLDEEPDILEHIRNGESIEHYETIRRRKDGKDLDISLTVSPVRDSQGRVIGASKIARDISDRKRAEEALQRAHDELESLVQRRTASLRRLSSYLLHVQDEERRRIARDLHDSAGQYLAAVKMNLAQLDGPDLTNAKTVLAESNQLLDTCLAEIRTISHLLHPPMLDESGLASAATWYVEGFTKRSGIQIELEISPRLERLPTDVEMVLFRALQESLTNVHRHSQSPKVEIRIELENGQATLAVRDYGRGITPQQLGAISGGSDFGVGLTGMRERVNELGGIFEVLLENPGTSVRVTLPVAKAESRTAHATENSAERKSAA